MPSLDQDDEVEMAEVEGARRTALYAAQQPFHVARREATPVGDRPRSQQLAGEVEKAGAHPGPQGIGETELAAFADLGWQETTGHPPEQVLLAAPACLATERQPVGELDHAAVEVGQACLERVVHGHAVDPRQVARW